MRKRLLLICALLCTNVLLAQTTFTIGDLTYQITGSNTAKVADCSTSTTSVVIPSTVTYQGTTYSVTSIGDDAFKYCSGLTSVTIPNSVNSIGEGAFYECIGLISVTIPNSVTSIGDNAFYKCRGLSSVMIPNSVTSIGGSAFFLVKYIIYNGTATGSPWGALSHNGFVEDGFVYVNNTKTSLLAYIGTDTNVTIPNSVTSIRHHAFYGCSGLTSVTIPNSVTFIGSDAFAYCSGLPSVTIPNSVTSIAWATFESCYGLTSITIPNSVTSIGAWAFRNCRGLTSITIPNSVTSIEYNAFYECTGLTSVTIPNSVTSIGGGAFYYCSGLTSVTIPNSVTSIGEGTFKYCSGLTSVTIPNSVTSIGSSAFSDCSGLTSVTIPNSVTSIGISAFSNCNNLRTLNFNAINCNYSNDISYLRDLPFYNSPISTINIGDSVQRIPTYFAYNLNSLTSVTICNSVTSIGYAAFYNCSGLTSVTIGNGVTSIGDQAFSDCSNLWNVYIKGTNPPSIENNTFSGSEDFYVPCQSVSSYQSALNWSNYSSHIYGKNFGEHSYNFVVNDSTLGSVSFTEIDCDSNVVVTVNENVGCRLIGWSDGGTGNPRTFHLTGDTMVTAILDYIRYSVIVQSNDTLRGVVIGSDTVHYGNTVAIAAISANGYQFTNWSNSSTLNPYTFTVTKDTNLVAYFEEIVPDTTFVHDTTYVPVHDTTYITQIDTVTNTVYDTITNTVYDTTYVPIHDTTYITQIDTVTNTVYDTITNTVYDTTYITQIDTVINTVHDTVTNTVYDTVTNTVYDTIDNFVYDTVYITETDTLWLFDTIYMHDTIYIYDTIYIRDSTTGIEDVSVINAKIYSSCSRIVVEGADGNNVMLFDMNGRLLATKQDEYRVLEFEVPISGAYFVKIGNYKAKKVVVIK